VVSGVLTLSG